MPQFYLQPTIPDIGKPVSRYRDQLPQLANRLFLTDGGLETTLVFHKGIPLPHFAAFTLLKDEAGSRLLRSYFMRYAELAAARNVGIVQPHLACQSGLGHEARLRYQGSR